MAQAKALPITGSAVRFNRFLALVYLVMAAGMVVTRPGGYFGEPPILS